MFDEFVTMLGRAGQGGEWRLVESASGLATQRAADWQPSRRGLATVSRIRCSMKLGPGGISHSSFVTT